MNELLTVVERMAYVLDEATIWLADLTLRVRILYGWTVLLTLAVLGLYINLGWRTWRGRS